MPASTSAAAPMILLAPCVRARAEQSLHLPQRLAPLHFRLGVDEIGDAFGGGQIELAVLERAPGEFAGLRGAQARRRSPSAATTAAITARPP